MSGGALLMKSLRWFGVVTILLLVALPSAATIQYTVSVAQPQEHFFRVRMTAPDVKDGLVVQLPAWNALYQVRDFAHRVQNVQAVDAGGRGLPVAKLDKQTWQVMGKGAITLQYAVLWDEPGPFACQLNADQAFVNFAMILFYVPERRSEDVRLEFADVPENWKIAVALRPGRTSFTYLAANYDTLVDAPAKLGNFEEFRIEVTGARVRVAVSGEGWNRQALEDMLRRVVGYETQLMRDVPFEEYIFLYHFGQGGGGMEHANSTAIGLSPGSTGAGVSAHEFFHLWNVKRIRPKSLEPVDYTREQLTRALWFAEGVTSTYTSYTLVRAGITTPRQFYDDLAAQISALEARPARLWQSVEQASLDAWLEKYSIYRRPDLSISYYNKGQILGALLDILVRDATNNRRSLDDVMRTLNETFAKKGRFYNDSADIRAVAEQIAGRNFGDFFRRYVAGTDELPAAEILALAGLNLTWKQERGRVAEIQENPQATDKQRRIREGLLRGTTN
jgi:predicted metalloprotease with PDZ domain